MVGSGDEEDSGPKLVWTAEADHYFLRLLQGYYREHGNVSKIDTHSWKRFEDEMTRFFRFKPPYKKLQAKRDRMRQVYRAWEQLLMTTGVGWDPINKVVECSNDTWQSYISVIINPLHFVFILILALCVLSSVELILILFLQKNKHGKDLRYKGLANEEICREIFGSTSAIGRMAYGSGSASAPPSNDLGGEQYDPPAPSYDDMDTGDHDDEEYVTPSPPAPTSGALPVNRRSRSIEKRRRKDKQLYKSDVVMQMWQKAFNDSKFSGSGSGSTAETPDLLIECQDILESMQLPTERYASALQLFVEKPSYQRVFVRMNPERRLGFLTTVLPMPPYIPQPPPPGDEF